MAAKTAFTKAGTMLTAALCAVVVVGGIGLWLVESRLASAHPECTTTGPSRVALAAGGPHNGSHGKVLGKVLAGLGCRITPVAA